MLHTSKVPNTLISMHRLCADNNVAIDFTVNSFSVKKESTQKVLLEGLAYDGLYNLSGVSVPSSTSSCCSSDGNIVSFIFTHLVTFTIVKMNNVWHRRLTHPSIVIVNKFVNSGTL